MRWATLVAALLVGLPWPLGAQELRPVPRPGFEGEEPAVRRQLEEERAALDALLADPDIEPARLAVAFGELGGLYYLYDLLEIAEPSLSNAVDLDPAEPRWRYLRGVVRTLRGEPQRALEDMEAVVGQDPGNVAAQIRRGRLLFDLGRMEEAAEAFRGALRRDPANAAALGGLGTVEVRLGLHREALPHLRQALEIQPTADALHYPLALALRATGEVEAAREALAQNRQGRLSFDDPWIRELGERSENREGMFHAGSNALRAGRPDLAAQYFETFLADDPEDERGRYYLALAYLQADRRKEGLELLRDLLSRNPEFRGAHRLLADTLAEDGAYGEALTHYEQAWRQDEESVGALVDWATALARVGRVDEALERLGPVAQGSDNHYARLQYAIILAGAGRGDDARPVLRDLVDSPGLREPLRGEAAFHLGLLAQAAGEQEEAIRELELAVELAPGLVEAQAALAPLLAQRGHFTRAAELYAGAVAAAPEDESLRLGGAMALLLDGRDGAALRALEEGRRALPESTAIHHTLARVLATSADDAVRDGGRAESLARELLALSPGPETAQTLAMALAENGRWSEAVALQRQVVETAERAGATGPDHRVRLERLRAYEERRPVRSPWSPSP